MDRPSLAKCKECGSPVIFAIRVGGEKDGKWMALDPDSVENGRWYVYMPRGDRNGSLRCKFMGAGCDWPPGSLPRNPHWMTCPAAEEFRRKRTEGSRSSKTPAEDLHRVEEYVARRRQAEAAALAASPPPSRKK